MREREYHICEGLDDIMKDIIDEKELEIYQKVLDRFVSNLIERNKNGVVK